MATEQQPLDTWRLESQIVEAEHRYDTKISTEITNIMDDAARQIGQRGILRYGVEEGAGGLCEPDEFSLAFFGATCRNSIMQELKLTDERLKSAFGGAWDVPNPFATAAHLENYPYHEVSIHYPTFGSVGATAFYALLLRGTEGLDEGELVGKVLLPVVTITGNVANKRGGATDEEPRISYGVQCMLEAQRAFGDKLVRYTHPHYRKRQGRKTHTEEYEPYDFLEAQKIGKLAIESVFGGRSFIESGPELRTANMLHVLYELITDALHNPHDPNNPLRREAWDEALTDHFKTRS